MIRHSPAEFYIKYLVAHPDGLSDAAILDLLERHTLDYPSRNYIVDLRASLDVPEPFKPRARHGKTYRWLVSEQLADIFEDDHHTKLMWRILEKPRAKEFIESVRLNDAPPIAIAKRLHELYGIHGCTVLAVVRYCHYFWNMDLVDSTEARAILTLRYVRLCASANPEEQMQGEALRRAYFNDPRKAAADLPHSSLSSLITQVQMGIIPEKMDMRNVMEASHMLVNLRLYQALASNGRDFDRQAMNLSIAAKTIQELKQSSINPEEELRHQLETIALKTDTQPLPLVHELTAGQHTVDLAALPEHKESK